MTPFSGKNIVTSPFGPRNSPITGQQENHKGQDITTTGDWFVRECTGGTVLRVTYDQWRGKYVDVQTAPGVFERYQHMERIDVAVGQVLTQGDTIGLAGSTGDSTGRHLHFEVQKNGVAVPPQQWSGVPNEKGTYLGNNSVDADASGRTDKGFVTLIVGPMSGGDRKTVEELAAKLALSFTEQAQGATSEEHSQAKAALEEATKMAAGLKEKMQAAINVLGGN